MSRLAGISFYYQGEEMNSMSWKNYLSVDSAIVCFLRDNKLGTIENLQDENYIIKFSFNALKQLCQHLHKLLTKEYWKEDLTLRHTVQEAESHWSYIVSSLESIIEVYEKYKDLNLEEVVVKFFECN